MKKIFLILIILIPLFSFQKKQKVKNQKPKNIILMIGDGMGLSQITAGMYANGNKLNLEQFKHIGFHKTHSADTIITDSAAGATAFSTGQKTYNGAIAVDVNKKSLKTILEMAEENKLSTGMVVTCSITHATPACFIAHASQRSKDEDIAMDFLKTAIDVFIGGGKKYFAERKDGKNLIDSLKARNYVITHSLSEVKNTNVKEAVFMADEHLPAISEGRDKNYLQDASSAAINILKNNSKGFFLMIEGSQIDWGGHDNKTDYIIDEMIDFDRAIGKVLECAKQDGNTLVIVTADHETGGFAITGGAITSQKVTGSFVSKNHSATMIPVFAFGPGAEEFEGFYENTEIFEKMKKLFGF